MPSILTFALAAGLSMPAAFQQTQQTPAPQDSANQEAGTPVMTDADFMLKAAEAGVKEVEVGKLAAEKASDQDVKAFGRRLVVDHSIANEELLKLSTTRKVALPVKLNTDLTEPAKPGQHAAPADLMTLEGAAFDRAFLDQVVKDHQEALDLFDEVADHSQDSELKEWAERKHQTLQDHLRYAKELQEKISR